MRVEASLHAPDAESGGVVLGYWANPSEAVVTHITTPGPKATRAATRFVPDGDHDELEIERIWRQTEGRSTYLGDWHSHPQSNGHLSWKDRRTLDRISRDPEAFAPRPLMLIVANGAERWYLTAWFGDPKSVGWFRWLRCERMPVLEY